mmetsp:Transcript_5750/g.8647  ORF Transcript_5750/g.8647 Transcript_5750/m.8647 type:complete len:88 (+) Transcript_5750:119-382(+)
MITSKPINLKGEIKIKAEIIIIISEEVEENFKNLDSRDHITKIRINNGRKLIDTTSKIHGEVSNLVLEKTTNLKIEKYSLQKKVIPG